MSNNMIELLERILRIPCIQIKETMPGIAGVMRTDVDSIGPGRFSLVTYTHTRYEKTGHLWIVGQSPEWVEHDEVWKLFVRYKKERAAKLEEMAREWLNEQLAQR